MVPLPIKKKKKERNLKIAVITQQCFQGVFLSSNPTVWCDFSAESHAAPAGENKTFDRHFVTDLPKKKKHLKIGLLFSRTQHIFFINHILSLTVLLSLTLRYIHALYLGAQSRWHSNGPRRHFHWRLMFESADITMLRLLEAFLKSAPQLVLQLSIMIHGNAVLPLQGKKAVSTSRSKQIFKKIFYYLFVQST